MDHCSLNQWFPISVLQYPGRSWRTCQGVPGYLQFPQEDNRSRLSVAGSAVAPQNHALWKALPPWPTDHCLEACAGPLNLEVNGGDNSKWYVSHLSLFPRALQIPPVWEPLDYRQMVNLETGSECTLPICGEGASLSQLNKDLKPKTQVSGGGGRPCL